MDPNLYTAAVNGNIKPFKKKGRNLEQIVSDRNDDTVLHVHIKFSKTPSIEFVKEILELCPSLLLQCNNEGDIPLHVAAEYGRSDVVEFLLKREKDQPQEAKTKMVEMKNDKKETTLDKAVKHAKTTMMPMIPKMNGGKMTLEEAAAHDRNAVVKILINEADLDFLGCDDSFGKILSLAAESGDLEMLDAVAKSRNHKSEAHAGPDEMIALRETFMNSDILGTKLKDTILHIYIKSMRTRSTKFVEKILHICPLLLLKTNEKGDTLLHVAARCGKSDIAKFLLQHAKNQIEEPNSEESVVRKMLKMRNTDDNTSFDVAVQCGNIGVVKLLIKEADADLLDFANNMNKILNLVANRGDYEMLLELQRLYETPVEVQRLSGAPDFQEALMNFNIPGMQSKSTILHVNINSFESSTEFVEKILAICPSLLLKVDDKNDTLLHIAARCGESAIAEILLKCAREQTEEPDNGERADRKMLKMRNSDNKTALDIAIEIEENEVLKTLIKEADTDFFCFTDNINQIINLAAENGDHELLNAVAKGSQGKTVLRRALEDSDIPGTQSRNPVLHIHINSSDPSPEFVEKILAVYPSQLRKVDDKGDTPLHVAARCGEDAIAEALLQYEREEKQGHSGKRADMEMLKMKNSDGNTALDVAVENEKVEVVKILIKEASPHLLDFHKILYLAAKRGDHEMVDAVAKSPNGMTIMNSDISETKSDDSILHVHIKSTKPTAMLVEKEHTVMFVEKVLNTCPSLLLKTNGKGDTPLHVAAKCGQSAIAQVLIKFARGETDQDPGCGLRANWQILRMTSKVGKKADCHMLRVKNGEGNTALHEAVRHGRTEMVKIFIGADPDFPYFGNKSEETPLYLAAAKGYHGMVSAILRSCESAAHQGPNGMTALHAAVMNFNILDHKGPKLAARQGPSGQGPSGMMAVHPMLMSANIPGPQSTTYQVPSGTTGLPPAATNFNIPGPKLATHQGPSGVQALHSPVMNSNIQGPKPAAYGMTTFRPEVMSSNIPGPSGMMSLHPTFMNSNFPGDTSLQIMREILLKKKDLARAQDAYGWTPLHYAAYHGLSNKVSLLLEFDKSAAYNADKDRKMTALHMAASQGHKYIIEKIISECVECCEMVDDRGWNVLHFAMLSLSKEELIDLLTNPLVGSLIDKSDHKGNTPLHIRAATYGDTFFHIGNRQVVNEQNVSVEHILLHGLYELEEEIQLLLEDTGNGQYSKGVIRDYRRKDDDCFKIRSERRKKYYDGLKKTRSSHLIVATLIATVTFTAAFTIPGGYSNEEGSDQGTAVLNRNSAFRAFIITDTIATTLSLSAVFVHVIMSFEKFQRQDRLLSLALWLTMLAMGTVVVAFVTGIYAVLAPSLWLAITTCFLGLSFFILGLRALILIYRRVFVDWLCQYGNDRGNVLPVHFKKGN